MAGFGIKDYIRDSDESNRGGRAGWLKQWKEKGKESSIVVWLHTLAPITKCHGHSFMLEDVWEDRDEGREKPVLRFPRFVSPDPDIVHRSQHFRDRETKELQVKPDRDPFLLLREWLRFAD